MSLFRGMNSFSQRPYHGGENWYGGQSDSDYMNTCFVNYFVRNTTVQDPPGGRKTRVVKLTHDHCVSGETIANFFESWFFLT